MDETSYLLVDNTNCCTSYVTSSNVNPNLTPKLPFEEKALVVLELFLYIGFLSIFIITIRLERPVLEGYYFNESIKFELVPSEFDSVDDPSDIFYFLRSKTFPSLYTKHLSNGTVVLGSVNSYNRVVGHVRLVQKRVLKDTCKVPKLFIKEIDHCYEDLTAENEEKNPFGPSKIWTWAPAEKISGYKFRGKLSTYSGGGYDVEFSSNLSQALEQLNFLESNSFIDDQTRAIFFDFSLYNPSLNLFSVIRLSFEQPSSGSIYTFSSFRSVKLFNSLTKSDINRTIFEFLVIIFELFYFIATISRLFAQGYKLYIKYWYHHLDLLIALVFGLVVYLRLSAIKYMKNIEFQGIHNMNFEVIAFNVNQQLNFLGILACLQCLKLFKFFRISHKLSQLVRVLTIAFADIVSFSVIFSVVLVSFAITGSVLFGVDLFEFRSIHSSCLTLFGMLMTNIPFEKVYNANRYVGPAFIIGFMFLGYFVLINMFLAIINDSFSLIRETHDKHKSCELFTTLSSITLTWFNRLFRLFGLRKYNRKDSFIGSFQVNSSDSKLSSGGLSCPHCKQSIVVSLG
ncbi:hypothetical protein RCL1_007748 [Eukaryota sp. TZLM3-RCL]